MSNTPVPAAEAKKGLIYALTSYLIWGLLPLYFIHLAVVNPFEVVAWRIVFTLILCAVLLTFTRGWGQVGAVMRTPKMVLIIGVAGLIIYVNWQTYVIGATTGYVVETALGYFVNPVVTILLGVIFLRERLRFWQWFALVMTVVAFVIISVGLGSIPWFALILALSFGLYGFMKKGIGDTVGALPGMFVETLMLVPVSAIILTVVYSHAGELQLFTTDPVIAWMIVGTGVTTAVPLLLFAASARRISLTALGFAQYLAPTLMFIIGLTVFGEHMPVSRWIGFGIVWVSLVILSIDLVRTGRSGPRVADSRPPSDTPE